ncbi:hypothetical protein GCM10009677_42130 [Sphaerisporangium rubeum]
MPEESGSRWLPRRSVLAGAVALSISAVAVESVLAPTGAAAEPRYTMDGWRFCVKCFELFPTTNTTYYKSVCPAGGSHQAAGWTFRLTYNVSVAGGDGEDAHTQGNWRLCWKCAAVFWAPGSSKPCAGGGGHDYVSTAQFLLPFNIGQPAGMQNQWRFCFKCSALFYNGYAYRGEYGRCPYDYIWGHTAAGYDFAIPVSAYT